MQNYSDAYSISQKYDNVKYGFGSKNPEKGKVDCSGWVIYLQNSDMKHINEFLGKEIFTKKDYFNSSIDAASELLENQNHVQVCYFLVDYLLTTPLQRIC